MFEVRATIGGFGARTQYRLYIPAYNYYVTAGPYAGPYVTHGDAQGVADALNVAVAADAPRQPQAIGPLERLVEPVLSCGDHEPF